MSEKRAIKRCYYEVLGVERDASDEEIRKSYKVLALKFHPDKNLDNSDDSAEFFREVQAAYEILSNPKERIWYDRHRDALLSGADKDSIQDFNFDILPYFTSSCYSGYDDTESGFYTVYRQVFDEIVKEDTPYYEDGQEELPSFGNSSSPFEDVHAFYSHWESYATPKTYSFLDEYNTVEAPNRRVARLMEKENKKVRDAAKKKRNEEIRTLVAFVRRRDKRVQAQRKILEKQREEKRQKSAEHRKKQLEARNKELEAEATTWAIMDDLEQELKEIEEEIESKESESRQRRKKKNKSKNKAKVDDQETGGQVDSSDKLTMNQDQDELNDGNISEDEESSSRELEDSELYCMACDKLFKSVKTFQNHEISKKHKANLVTLKQVLEQEEQLLLDSESAKS